MSLTDKYPNLTDESTVVEFVKEALSSVGIVPEAKVVTPLAEIVEHFVGEVEADYSALVAAHETLRKNFQDVSKELEALKTAPVPEVVPDVVPEVAPAPEQQTEV